MKKVLIAVAAVVVVVVAAVFVLYSNLDSIVKAAVEDIGSKATGARVTLNEVKLSPTSGEGALRGFTLGNPEGYKTASAMRFGEVSVKLSVASLAGDTVTVNEVVILAPEVTYELGGPAGSNIQAIQRNVNAFAGGKPAAGGEAPPAAEDGKKLIIENLYVREGRIGVSADFLQGRQMEVPLPSIHLRDIGKDGDGVTAAEVAERLMTEIAAQAQKAVSSLDLGKMMEGVEGRVGEGAKALEDGARGAGDAVRGLFGR